MKSKLMVVVGLLVSLVSIGLALSEERTSKSARRETVGKPAVVERTASTRVAAQTE